MFYRNSSTLIAATVMAVVPTDVDQNPTCISFAVSKTASDGRAAVSIQYTLDNVFDPNIEPTWFDHSLCSAGGLGSAATMNMEGGFDLPVAAVRCNVVTVSVSGGIGSTVTFWTRQAG